jgi:hypothetical protein
LLADILNLKASHQNLWNGNDLEIHVELRAMASRVRQALHLDDAFSPPSVRVLAAEANGMNAPPMDVLRMGAALPAHDVSGLQLVMRYDG